MRIDSPPVLLVMQSLFQAGWRLSAFSAMSFATRDA
jgi:hypothetical protein